MTVEPSQESSIYTVGIVASRIGGVLLLGFSKGSAKLGIEIVSDVWLACDLMPIMHTNNLRHMLGVLPAVSARGCRLLPSCRLIPCSFFRVSKLMVVDS